MFDEDIERAFSSQESNIGKTYERKEIGPFERKNLLLNIKLKKGEIEEEEVGKEL